MQKMMSHMRSAMQQYNMIDEGDKVAVGLSGGKDSVAMLVALANLRRFYPKPFDLTAITLDPCFNNEPGDYSALQSLCDGLEIPYILKRTELGKVIFETRKEKNPCSLCARMRRGALHDAARAAGCNKLALGHHMDDAAETFLMNLLNGGHIGCFSPVTYMSRKDITVIRPMRVPQIESARGQKQVPRRRRDRAPARQGAAHRAGKGLRRRALQNHLCHAGQAHRPLGRRRRV